MSEYSVFVNKDFPVLTTDNYPGKEITFLEFICAEQVASIDGVEGLIEVIVSKASSAGANAIVGFRLNEALSNSDLNYRTAYGTAVKFV